MYFPVEVVCEGYAYSLGFAGYSEVDLFIRFWVLYCIVLYLLPILNPKSYDGARVLKASGRPMLVIGRSYGFVSIQAGMKLTEESFSGSLVYLLSSSSSDTMDWAFRAAMIASGFLPLYLDSFSLAVQLKSST